MSMQSMEDKVQAGLSDVKLISTLRLTVKPPGKKGTWLQLLNDRQLLGMYYRMQAGKTPTELARLAQNDWGIKRQADFKSMARGVREFRDRTLGEVSLVGSDGTKQAIELSQSLLKKARAATEKIDALGVLGRAINIQAARIEALHEAELRSLPFKHTDGAMRTLGELIGLYVKLQIDLGLIQAQPHEFNLSVQHSFTKIQDGLEGKGPAAANALGRFLQWAEKESVHMKLDPDTGAYVPVHEGEDNARITQQP